MLPNQDLVTLFTRTISVAAEHNNCEAIPAKLSELLDALITIGSPTALQIMKKPQQYLALYKNAISRLLMTNDSLVEDKQTAQLLFTVLLYAAAELTKNLHRNNSLEHELLALKAQYLKHMIEYLPFADHSKALDAIECIDTVCRNTADFSLRIARFRQLICQRIDTYLPHHERVIETGIRVDVLAKCLISNSLTTSTTTATTSINHALVAQQKLFKLVSARIYSALEIMQTIIQRPSAILYRNDQLQPTLLIARCMTPILSTIGDDIVAQPNTVIRDIRSPIPSTSTHARIVVSPFDPFYVLKQQQQVARATMVVVFSHPEIVGDTLEKGQGHEANSMMLNTNLSQAAQLLITAHPVAEQPPSGQLNPTVVDVGPGFSLGTVLHPTQCIAFSSITQILDAETDFPPQRVNQPVTFPVIYAPLLDPTSTTQPHTTWLLPGNNLQERYLHTLRAQIRLILQTTLIHYRNRIDAGMTPPNLVITGLKCKPITNVCNSPEAHAELIGEAFAAVLAEPDWYNSVELITIHTGNSGSQLTLGLRSAMQSKCDIIPALLQIIMTHLRRLIIEEEQYLSQVTQALHHLVSQEQNAFHFFELQEPQLTDNERNNLKRFALTLQPGGRLYGVAQVERTNAIKNNPLLQRIFYYSYLGYCLPKLPKARIQTLLTMLGPIQAMPAVGEPQSAATTNDPLSGLYARRDDCLHIVARTLNHLPCTSLLTADALRLYLTYITIWALFEDVDQVTLGQTFWQTAMTEQIQRRGYEHVFSDSSFTIRFFEAKKAEIAPTTGRTKRQDSSDSLSF